MNLQQQRIIQFFKHIAGQKFTWFASLMVCLTVTAFNTRPEEVISTAANDEVASIAEEDLISSAPAANTDTEEVFVPAETPEAALPQIERIAVADRPAADIELNIDRSTTKKSGFNPGRLIAYAQGFLGTPYIYGGTSPKGFDCSGYVYHVFSKFGLEINRSSRTQSTQGDKVAVEEVVPGDVLFFTGTNPKVRKVGHVGIVISEPGEPVTFIHSSSNGGVKISELEGYYDTRFMFAKRMN